jgi:hypothetical protein
MISYAINKSQKSIQNLYQKKQSIFFDDIKLLICKIKMYKTKFIF